MADRENSENDETGDNLDELCGEEEIDSHPSLSEECSEEEQQSEEPEEITERENTIRTFWYPK